MDEIKRLINDDRVPLDTVLWIQKQVEEEFQPTNVGKKPSNKAYDKLQELAD